MLTIFGWAAAILIGVSLGLIGGGGSILSVPVLVYLFGLKPLTATGYSLFIVGVTSLVGAGAYFRRGQVDLRMATAFALPAIGGVFLARGVLLPALPETLGTVGPLTITRGKALLLLFAVLMVAASVSMIRDRRPEPEEGKGTALPIGKLLPFGFLVGCLTGFVGAGGGFLIVPALVLLANLPIKRALGTSLVVIAANSLLGFVSHVRAVGANTVDWGFLLGISAVAVLGILIGTLLGQRICGATLKPAFGWFVLAMGGYVVARELFFAG